MRQAKTKAPRKVGVGMPAWIMLNQFGQTIFDAYGDWPYLVGSAAKSKKWRDVDVRLILSDEVFLHWFGEPQRPAMTSRRWSAHCLAFSFWGRQMTGLPIDFQIQGQTEANKENGPRHALILCANGVAK